MVGSMFFCVSSLIQQLIYTTYVYVFGALDDSFWQDIGPLDEGW